MNHTENLSGSLFLNVPISFHMSLIIDLFKDPNL